MLRDDISRERFTRLVLYRLLGHLHARVSDEAPIDAAADDAAFQEAADQVYRELLDRVGEANILTLILSD